MLDEKTLNDFIKEVNDAYLVFCVWKHTHNKLYITSEKWLIPAEGWQNLKVPKFGNFWRVVSVSLQDMWILSTARLFDKAHFNNDKTKPARLSIYYLLELLNDKIFEEKIKLQLKNHKIYTDSIRECRDNFLAHKSVNVKMEKIREGIENFFEELNKVISEIKDKETHLKSCNDIGFQDIEKSCEDNVEKILQTLLKN